jgi:hypothetical protein
VSTARRLAALVLALLAAALPLAPAALADGDPASDTLLYADAFYPYRPNLVPKPLQQALDRMLRETRRKGFGLKVAIIAAPTDLGSVPQLFTSPQPYADLLTKEITYNNHPRVLVVLPAGIGGNNLGDHAGDALAGISPDPDAGAEGLARTAMQAVARLAKANGTPVAVPHVAATAAGSSSGGGADSGGVSPLLTFGLPVALVLLGAGGAALRNRSRAEEEEEDVPEEAVEAE